MVDAKMNFENKSLLKTALLSVSGANGNLRTVNSQIGSTILMHGRF